MDTSVKPQDYTRYSEDFLSAWNGPSLNDSHPPPQYTPRDTPPMQGRQAAKQAEYYHTRPMNTQESANPTRQDEYHHYQTNPNFYHNRNAPYVAPAVGRNASPIATQNEYHCYQTNPNLYHNRRDNLDINSTAAQGVPMAMQATMATEYKLGQVAQQQDFYCRRQEEASRGRGQFGAFAASSYDFDAGFLLPSPG
ncbi:uncharacterized protein CDV56_100607 [Aspergillus thermomutatus]|uniref:Uncharacterized protein n=1 Tax=Aspergillus thermomutatus TaxID=41047 RepID=A0A397H615_ASPTH|nr:uncharacterized protein CDV56_100607 [Aspergillus thermomutatus]RHZ58511.1 hypothetical protein CDV56_100607 [Aspergillus thermomutatus]